MNAGLDYCISRKQLCDLNTCANATMAYPIDASVLLKAGYQGESMRTWGSVGRRLVIHGVQPGAEVPPVPMSSQAEVSCHVYISTVQDEVGGASLPANVLRCADSEPRAIPSCC